jgi:hypothetical protein
MSAATRHFAVARMKAHSAVIRDFAFPDSAALHPGCPGARP